ncbi:hypothetical protein MHU86_7908 [Fragilaria crotonensis]|nr:hypothetical protein MHU86_7908 [Fragilaria crotonensis]
MQSDKPNSYRTVPTNDGTHRVNVKWNPPESTHAYEKDKKKLHDAIYELVREIVPDTVGVLYRWESEDLVLSKIVKDMTALDLRDFISPAITFIHAQQQIVFGIRLGFRIPPGQWMRSDLIKGFIKSKTIDVSVSNSTSTSGKMVTAGYVLLKAPNTTQLTRYTQFLRSILPEQTPYFDVVRYKKTPLDQFIPHLRIQCGEKHVTPLCQALLPVLTGRGSAMFIPRYALGAMADEQIRRHFLFHEKWCKSLKAVPLSPHVNHLDQKRIEYHEDGTTLERSTREWMATILAPDQNSPALCDVVNGPPDFKAYLLVPSHYLQVVQQEWQQYKARLFPPRHREARFRDNLPGLPHVIHIQAEIEAHVSFFEKLSEASVWQLTSESSRNPSTVSAADENRYNRRIGINQQLNARSGWPTPAEVSPRQKPRDQTTRPNQQSLEDSEQHSTGGDTSIGTTDDDRSTASTRSLTHASRTSATDARFSELELQMNKKLQALDASGKASLNRLLSMEQQFHRIDDMDKKLAAVNKTLDAATKQMELSTSTHQEISSDMAELKVHTAQQFTEMNQRLLSNMECQHKMSTTLLDLRGHFEKMSAFMEGLATKMELDRTKASSAFTQASNGGVGSRSADIRGIPNDLQSTASSDSTTSGSSTSKTSVQSDASSTIYSSRRRRNSAPMRKLDSNTGWV